MCLFVSKPEPKAAKEDIVAYKVVYVVRKETKLLYSPIREDYGCLQLISEQENMEYRTPYRHKPIKMYETMENPDEMNIKKNESTGTDFWEINEGVFHLFCYYRQAKKFAAILTISALDVYAGTGRVITYHVIEAVIPKGTEYYDGYFSSTYGNYWSYGARSVLYREIKEEPQACK